MDATQTARFSEMMITLTHVKRFPFTFEPLTTCTRVLSGYSEPIVDASASQSLLSQSALVMTPLRSALSLYSMHSGSDSTLAGDGVANGLAVGVGVAVASAGVGVVVGVGVGLVGDGRAGVGVGVAATTLDEDAPGR